jgi:hypothetical protein
MKHMKRGYLIPFTLLALAATAPIGSPEDLIRRANTAFLAGDGETAESLYAAAEERTGDPGLVSFNKAAVQFQKGDFHAAEVNYARTLDDKACPGDRAAKAWFNRGTCLLRRGGTAPVYRSAIACFDRCLESNGADAPLKADARKNLELAKLLWIEANKKAAKPNSPNESTQEDPPSEPPPSKNASEPGSENGNQPGAKKDVRPAQVPKSVLPPKAGPGGDGNTGPANNPALQPIADDGNPQKLSPEDSREHLRRAEVRMIEERRNLLKTLYGPPRPGVRDW